MPQTLELNSFSDPATNGSYGPVTTTDSLVAGEEYVAVVRGTAAHFSASKWEGPDNKVCGTSEPDAIYPSPGRPQSQVGQDAEFVFGLPMPAGWQCPAMPEHKSAFEIDTGSGFTHVEPDGNPAAPTSDHVYTYRFTGQGGPVSFRMRDGYSGDNYGIFKINVGAADGCPGDCTDPEGPPEPPPPPPPPPNIEPSVDPPVEPVNPLPPAKKCASRRRFRIKIVSKRSDPVVAAKIWLDGKRLKVERKVIQGRRRLTTIIDLRGLPAKRVTVRIHARTKSGRVLKGTRKYWTCRGKLPYGTPPLR